MLQETKHPLKLSQRKYEQKGRLKSSRWGSNTGIETTGCQVDMIIIIIIKFNFTVWKYSQQTVRFRDHLDLFWLNNREKTMHSHEAINSNRPAAPLNAIRINFYN